LHNEREFEAGQVWLGLFLIFPVREESKGGTNQGLKIMANYGILQTTIEKNVNLFESAPTELN
jgi:hypothetical protein